MFTALVGGGDFLGMYALGVLVRQLHHSEDNPLLQKLGVDKWSDRGRRMLGISLATAINAVVNAVLVATISPNIPERYKLVPSVALGVFAYFLTTAQRTSKKGAAAPDPPACASKPSTKRLMPALSPDEDGLCVESSLLVGRSLDGPPARRTLRRGNNATRAVLRLERSVSGKSMAGALELSSRSSSENRQQPSDPLV